MRSTASGRNRAVSRRITSASSRANGRVAWGSRPAVSFSASRSRTAASRAAGSAGPRSGTAAVARLRTSSASRSIRPATWLRVAGWSASRPSISSAVLATGRCRATSMTNRSAALGSAAERPATAAARWSSSQCGKQPATAAARRWSRVSRTRSSSTRAARMSSTMFQKSGWRDAASSAKEGSRSARWMRPDHLGQADRILPMFLMKQAPERAQDGSGNLARPAAVGNRVAQEIGEGLAEEAQVRTGAPALRPAGQGRAGGTQGRPDVVGFGRISRGKIAGGKVECALASAGGSFRSEFSIMDHASLFDPSGERGLAASPTPIDRRKSD